MKKAFFLLYIFVIAGCIFDADEASESSTSSGSQNPKLVMAYYENWRQYSISKSFVIAGCIFELLINFTVLSESRL